MKTEPKRVTRATFVGDGADEVMRLAYPAIAKTLDVPVQEMWDLQARNFFKLGLTQRYGHFRALDKELSDREKDQIAYDQAVAYTQHLRDGGDWRRDPDRGLTQDLITAMVKVQPQFTEDAIRAAYKADPAQATEWRRDPSVRLEMAKQALDKAKRDAKDQPKQELKIKLPQ